MSAPPVAAAAWVSPASRLAYSGVLAGIAGFVNSVALLVWAFPVGNLTALTTQAGMHSTYPLVYQGRMIAAIVFGFFVGATAAGRVLAAARAFIGPRHAVVLLAEAALLVAAAGLEHPIARAALAAGACGLQNGMTSNFPGMPVRTTHFTGTITDLGLLVGRSSGHGVDKWKATVLTTTVVLFVGGAAVGVLIGNRIGDHALVPPALACLAVAATIVLHDRRRSARVAHATARLWV
ncbi:YoaK family protein [Mycobacterium intracellulare]|uniref:YoaK family protein n=1 Tax=Mycobacterium intracellulare TaxID=1767 RepID=UPI0006CA9FE5|nr:YoaK family protein [Mycobacterium intracellulare]KPN46525.1 hypothetical protein AN933_26000 [Mycobacterium intracellulare subsp. chimaera]